MDAPSQPPFSLGEAETDRIGPVARMLVKREMKRASSLAELTKTLARSIPDESDRRSFCEAFS